VKRGTGSQVLIHYTEESRETVKEKEVGKQIRGGGQLSVEDGKNMMITGLESSWSEGMLGVEDESSDELDIQQLALDAAGPSGIGSQKRLKLEDGQASGQSPGAALGILPAKPAKAAKPTSRKEKEALAKAEKDAAKKQAKEDKALQEELAKEQAAAQLQADQKAQQVDLAECLLG
jgi:hypothetical protein